MIYLIVSIKDRATESFQPLQNVRAKGEAIRAFQDAIANPQSAQLHTHPDDFDLYLVGTFNDQDGTISPIQPPEKLADGKSLQITERS